MIALAMTVTILIQISVFEYVLEHEGGNHDKDDIESGCKLKPL